MTIEYIQQRQNAVSESCRSRRVKIEEYKVNVQARSYVPEKGFRDLIIKLSTDIKFDLTIFIF